MGRYQVHRSDGNAKAIADGLRERGVAVAHIGRPCDLLCGFRRQNFLLEVKRPGAKRKDQPKQDEFLATWPGQVKRVETLEQALKEVGVTR